MRRLKDESLFSRWSSVERVGQSGHFEDKILTQLSDERRNLDLVIDLIKNKRFLLQKKQRSVVRRVKKIFYTKLAGKSNVMIILFIKLNRTESVDSDDTYICLLSQSDWI